MSPQSLPHERILAVLHSLCITWVSVACVSLCILYGGSPQWSHAPLRACLTAGQPFEDDCGPETEALTVATPGRHSVDLEDGSAAPCPALAEAREPDAGAPACPLGAPPDDIYDPLFERMRILSI